MTPKVKAHIERTIISEFEMMEADFTMEELKAIASYNRSKQNPPNNKDRKSTRLNSSHSGEPRMPSSA